MSKPKVFLDTSVILDLLRGDPTAAELLSDDSLAKYTYVTSPIVLQELLLVGARAGRHMDLSAVEPHISILPLEYIRDSRALQDRVRRLRNRIVHSNDALIVASADAAGCDYLVTMDRDLIAGAESCGLIALEPAALLEAKER